MAPVGGQDLSAKRAQFAGPSGIKGIIANGKTTAIASFAALGGFVYGYNQGMFGQILTMYSFTARMEPWYSGTTGTRQALLTAILELGAWLGALINGYLADAVGRRITVVIACVIFTVGVIVQACTLNKDYVLAGRFVTGIGVGAFSMLVPLYNAELAPPEVRGALVALQQLAITFGIMVSYWIGYGTNYIGGTGEGQSDAAWLIPICIQLLPSTILAVGMVAFMPQSPRHLMNRDREQECLETLARLRKTSIDDIRIRVEFLEIKAQRDFERQRIQELFPQYQDGSFKSNFMIGWNDYLSLVTNKALFRRTIVAVFVMVFQQWNGVNAILYYAPFIFDGLGLSGNTISLLATGVVGIVMFLATIPAVLWVDNFGRKTILIAGGIGMAASHFIVAGITGSFEGQWEAHRGAGWAAVVFVWVYAVCFGFSWGPVAWIIISEVFPLGLRAKGVSIGGSSNWLNNFAVAMSTSPFISTSQFGAFIFFGVITVIGVLWVFFFVPETKGRTLEEMDEVFGEVGFAREDLERKARIERDIGLTALLGGNEPVTTAAGTGVVGEKDGVAEIGGNGVSEVGTGHRVVEEKTV
ncbi:putative MFS monosaccharide transporter [Aspergillus stella-maris]|uniref:putative MFS monosaccharide transporter n=1 Tax=Aspergillus stella-maris TaxID=1810926 RepID=UPI003CCDAE5D